MPNHRPGFVAKDFERGRVFGAAVVGPAEITRQHVFGPLQPFKTNHGSGGSLGVARLYRAMRERINIVPSTVAGVAFRPQH